MGTSIKNLALANVWKHFYSLTQIPRPSGQMKEISAFMVTFGKQLGLETLTDDCGNVLIRKPATAGFENRKTIILQGHLDMVPQKNSDTNFDFSTDPIDAYIDGEWVKAKGTTLGADNGIGVAATMALLEDNSLQHGPIEALFTIDEETGMDGAFGIKPGFLAGDIMLNLDSEREGELCVGCAGGADLNISFRYKDDTNVPKGDIAVKLSLTGLKGGHSGVDIHLGRANANKLLFRFLKDAVQNLGARLASIEGGSLRNAIPREAFAVVTIPGDDEIEVFWEMVSDYQDLFNAEYARIENQIKFTAERIDKPEALIPEEIQDDLINAVVGCPNGVISMLTDFPNTVETSSNLAVIQSSQGKIEIKILARSSSESKKAHICSSIESVFALAGAKIEDGNAYPGWNPNIDSPMLSVMKRIYKEQFGEESTIEVIHAGLECGIILASVPGLDTVSFGPTIKFPHSPDEKVKISTVQHFWDYLKEVLKQAPALLVGLVFMLSGCSPQGALFEDYSDVGSCKVPGSMIFDTNANTYILTGAGTNMWSVSDEFFMAWQKVSGDFSLSAKIAFEGDGVNPHRKMGLIIRESLDVSSTYADVAIHGDGLTSLQYRRQAGAETQEVVSVNKAPDYILLQRIGNKIIMKTALGKFPELTDGEIALNLPETCYVGLFICSHEAERTETGYFSEVGFSSSDHVQRAD